MMVDKNQVKAAKDNLLGDADLAELLEENQVAQGRPINDLEHLVDPGDKTKHPYYLQPWFRIGAVSLILIILGTIGYLIWGPKSKPSLALGDKDKQIIHLTERLQQSDVEKAQLQQDNMELTQAADLEPFEQRQQEKKRQQLRLQQQPRPPQPRSRPPVNPRHVVTVPRRLYASPPVPQRRYTPSRPNRTLFARADSNQPSLSECVGYLERGISVPSCARHRISQKVQKSAQPTSVSDSKPNRPIMPRPTNKNPIKLAFNPTAKRKPDYQVNYAAGEIQTVDQFQEEFYGSGQTSAPQLSRMTAKVIDHVEWLSPEDAQKMIIPLQITSGSHKGQTAEAKISQINGLQFTAYLISLNGQEVEPGTLELRRQNTKYLRADLKHQGGESFGDKILGTVTAIGGEIASDQLANVRGGNQISRLVSSPRQQGREVTQYWKFDGKVEIVPVN
ncbi:MAG: hypothetical protein HC768_19200 [Acaryochloris sp. CRU_2_0]|nr:hypothetical protein [Acaryochloris sp. CRU_2_0]